MKVLVTGAGGNLARVVVPALAAAGHTLRLLDFRPIDTAHDLLQGDLRNPDDLVRAVDGVDAVVHAAALHGIHRGHWRPQDFWAINVDGTFNLYAAATTAKVAKIVLASSMAVYGRSLQPPADAWGIVTEDSPILPDDEYGLSKWLGEELARYHARRQDLATVALRLGMFVPETFERYGFRLLFGGVDDRDVAQAVLLALEHQPAGGFEAVNVMAQVPFQPADAVGLHADPAAVLERYWPGCTQLFDDRGLELEELLWGRLIWPIDKAKRVLGYRPGHNFGEFLTALRAGDTGYYPFANLPWWGVGDALVVPAEEEPISGSKEPFTLGLPSKRPRARGDDRELLLRIETASPLAARLASS